MKKTLYFFPDDVGITTSGNKTRVRCLLDYFKTRSFEVHFVSLKHERDTALQHQHTSDILYNEGLASRTYLLTRKASKKNLLQYFFKYKIWDLLYYYRKLPLRTSIPTVVTTNLLREFEEILKANTYDYIIISYVYYSDLVSKAGLLGNAKVIIDTHDFITAQYKNRSNFRLGVTIEDEINRLNSFHEIWAISPEEQYIFRQFCKSNVRLVPFTMKPPVINAALVGRQYHIIYVASDNSHNIRASSWFFSEVYPLLPVNFKICVVGKICSYISEGVAIQRVIYCSDLSTYYNDSYVAICPMFSGSGVKIKVIEALSYGLPVICTDYGADGLPNKVSNGCIVHNDAVSFANSIVELLKDESLYEYYSNQAKSLFQRYFSSENIDNVLDPVFND
ncbi:glycosyltransferase family 4 protein [Dyadobacter chenwenxiniae]|uniref:Glycosyltransferase family 4 protein n=1 Tax=Dyadobacter chenwenxiniae TaxID=2906456 RepID=A0A9X1PIY8_9BACT|nr:glycosyltransferase [Dyadobacter chenwenxiniae]MCF0061718.1 glycosyltransferase family 4 protein [Dyadobacter chenwenxiniae]UON81536.1 glycosyltransferase family 4 protein [Dyadobacter chenwenxiniae]